MEEKTISSLFLISAIAAVAFIFLSMGNTVDYTDIRYIWQVDYNEKSDYVFFVCGKKIGEIKSDTNKLATALNATDAYPWSPGPRQKKGPVNLQK
jgi:hypothetical protein